MCQGRWGLCTGIEHYGNSGLGGLGHIWWRQLGWSCRTHSWLSMRCISSLMLRAVLSSSAPSGWRGPSLSDREVSSSTAALRSRFRPPMDGTLMGDKCRDYRGEAGCMRRGWAGRPQGEAGPAEGGQTEKRHSYMTGTETGRHTRTGQGCGRRKEEKKRK